MIRFVVLKLKKHSNKISALLKCTGMKVQKDEVYIVYSALIQYNMFYSAL
jgi:hypothetical protein